MHPCHVSKDKITLHPDRINEIVFDKVADLKKIKSIGRRCNDLEYLMFIFVILAVYIFLRSLFKGKVKRRRGGGYTYWHDSQDANEDNMAHASADENEMEFDDDGGDDD